jgi:hypothetical protein
MTSRRFPPPWTVIENAESFWVQDAGGQTVGWFYFRHNEDQGASIFQDGVWKSRLTERGSQRAPPAPRRARSASRQLDIAVDLKFEIDTADRNNSFHRQRVAAFQLTLRVSGTHGRLELSLGITPNFLSNLRTLVLRASSSMVVLPTDHL